MDEPRPRKHAAVVLRVFLIGLILVLLGFVVFFIIRGANRASVVRPEMTPLTEQKVDVQGGLHFSQDTGGGKILYVEAALNFSGPDGLYHLVGRNTQATFFRFVHSVLHSGCPVLKWYGGDLQENRVRIESQTTDGQVRFSGLATEVAYDIEWKSFVFRGDVEIVLDKTTVKGSTFAFDRVRNEITTDSPVTFTGERFRGDCRRALYDAGSEKLRFYGGVNLVAAPWATDPFPLVITGDEMTYEKSSRTGRIVGNISLTHGKSRGRADVVDFAQFADKDGFRMFEFRGGVSIDADERRAERAAPGKPAAPGAVAPAFKEEDLIFFQGGRQVLTAGVITILPYPGEEWLHLISLKEGGRIEILSDDGRRTTLQAGELDFFYNADGSLQDFNLRRDVRILGEAEGQVRLVEAPKIDFNANAGDLVTSGGRARTVLSGRDVGADEMVINLQTNNFRMSGDVRIVSRQPAGEERDVALFDATKPLFMTAGSVFYEAELRRFQLSERARVWQGRDSLEAERVEIFEEAGDLVATGSVRSVFFQRPKGKEKDERIEITSNRLVRDSKKGRVDYLGGCSLSVAEIVLKSGRLILHPAQEAGKFEKIFADQSRVSVVQGLYKALGDQADYDLVEDLIVLTGQPTLEHPEKGLMRGGKLTFSPADGKISVENLDTGRSTTIIKS